MRNKSNFFVGNRRRKEFTFLSRIHLILVFLTTIVTSSDVRGGQAIQRIIPSANTISSNLMGLVVAQKYLKYFHLTAERHTYICMYMHACTRVVLCCVVCIQISIKLNLFLRTQTQLVQQQTAINNFAASQQLTCSDADDA